MGEGHHHHLESPRRISLFFSGALLDILQRTGVKGHTAFLESLELDYPQLYSRITGKEPNKTFSILIGLSVCLSIRLSPRPSESSSIGLSVRHQDP